MKHLTYLSLTYPVIRDEYILSFFFFRLIHDTNRNFSIMIFDCIALIRALLITSSYWVHFLCNDLMILTGELAAPNFHLHQLTNIHKTVVDMFWCFNICTTFKWNTIILVICGLNKCFINIIYCIIIIYHLCFRCRCIRLWRICWSWEQSCRGGWRTCKRRAPPTPCPLPLNTLPPPHTPRERHCTLLSDTQGTHTNIRNNPKHHCLLLAHAGMFQASYYKYWWNTLQFRGILTFLYFCKLFLA